MSSASILNRKDAFGSILGNINDQTIRQIALEKIVKSAVQPRTHFDNEKHKEMVESIRKHGVIQPILVREISGGYELVAGERRVRASQEAKLESIPALIKKLNDEEVREIALLENLQREDLNPIEETDGILILIGFKLKKSESEIIDIIRDMHYLERGRVVNTSVDNTTTSVIQETLSSLGHSSASSFYNHRLPLLKLPEDLLSSIREGQLEYSKASILARVKDETTRKMMTTRVINEKMSREALIKEMRAMSNTSPLPQKTKISEVKKLLSDRKLKKLEQQNRERVEELLAELHSLLS
jgi:ParB family transcriptional regulator, chromosome partitioning protein